MLLLKEKTVYVSELRKPVNWRWERARELSELNKKNGVRFQDDELTSQAVKYLNLKKSGADNQELAKNFPLIYEADAINSEATVERWTLESLMVSGEPLERVADYTGATVDLLKTYEGLFFDVRSRLSSPGFFNMRIMGNSLREVRANDPDGMWKLIGYHGGPQMLYAFWSCKLPDVKVMDFFKGWRRWALLQSAARACQARVPDGFNTRDVIDESIHLEEVEAALNAQKPADTTVNTLLQQLNYTIANITPEANRSNDKKEQRATDKLKAQLEAAGIPAELLGHVTSTSSSNITKVDND